MRYDDGDNNDDYTKLYSSNNNSGSHNDYNNNNKTSLHVSTKPTRSVASHQSSITRIMSNNAHNDNKQRDNHHHHHQQQREEDEEEGGGSKRGIDTIPLLPVPSSRPKMTVNGPPSVYKKVHSQPLKEQKQQLPSINDRVLPKTLYNTEP